MLRINHDTIAVSVSIVFATALTATADPAALPPEVGWTTHDSSIVMHLDVERMANSVLAPMLDNPFRIDEPEDRVWQKLVEQLPMSFGEDIRSITAISVGPLDSDFVAICRMSARADLLPAVMAEHIPGYRVTDIDGYTVHSWAEIVEDERRHIYSHLRTVSETERLWFITMNWEHLLDTIAFAERADEDHAPFDLSNILPPRLEHSALFVHMSKSTFSGAQESVRPHLENVDWIAIDIGATETQCSVRITGGMATEQHAAEIAQITQGMLALGRMTLREKESMQPIMRLIDRTRIVTDGSMVMLELNAEAALLTEVFEVVKPHLGAARGSSGRFRLELGAQMDQPNGGKE